MGSVPTDMKPSRLMKILSQYGNIEESPTGYDNQTSKSRGFSIIVYKTIEATTRAVEDPIKSIDCNQFALEISY